MVVWKQLAGGLFEIYQIVPGGVASTAAVIIGSLLTSAPSTGVVEHHDTLVSDLHSREY